MLITKKRSRKTFTAHINFDLSTILILSVHITRSKKILEELRINV